MATYNGWTNYETWLINLHFDGYFMPNTDAETIKETVEELACDDLQGRLFVMDMINAFLDEVNWEEIASHYQNEAYAA